MYSSGRGGLNFAVLGDPLRLRIVEVLTEWGPLSPSEMVNRRLCDDLPNINGKTTKQQVRVVKYHCDKLEEADFLTLRREAVRGATKHIYSANVEAIFPDSDWAALDKDERESLTNNVYRRFLAAVQMSMQGRLFDERTDRVLGWGPLTLDEQGWTELVEHMTRAFHSVEDEIKVGAQQRLREDPAAVPLRATYGFFAFESPMPKFFAT
jgi:hypothetical protein